MECNESNGFNEIVHGIFGTSNKGERRTEPWCGGGGEAQHSKVMWTLESKGENELTKGIFKG